MENEASDKPERSKTLDKMVAITVVILSVFMAVTKVKDDNIVQAMQKAKAESVDAWAEYQAARLKLHSAEHSRTMLSVMPADSPKAREIAAAIAEQDKDVERYTARSKETMSKAKALEKLYEELNAKDDQFDLSDVFTSIAIALAAVAALTEMWSLLYISWASGGLGIALGMAAFLNWGLRIQWLIDLLS